MIQITISQQAQATGQCNNHNSNPYQLNMNSKPINLLQWNCRGLRTSLPDLQILISTHHPAVISLQETQITDTGYKALPQYQHICKPATASATLPKGGVSLYIHNQIPTSTINSTTALQAVAARITGHKPTGTGDPGNTTNYMPEKYRTHHTTGCGRLLPVCRLIPV